MNGEYWGLYLAVEAVEDSFLERNNMTTGELYKPDSMSFGGGRGNGRDFDFERFRVDEDEEDGATSEEESDSGSAGTGGPDCFSPLRALSRAASGACRMPRFFPPEPSINDHPQNNGTARML